MKKYLIISLGAFLTWHANAQTFKDTFDTNTLYWTEISSEQGEAVIKDGVMHLVGKNSGGMSLFGYKAPSFVETHCFSTIDVTKNFEVKCDAIAKKINDNGAFGVMLDYIDAGNFLVFVVAKEYAYLYRFRDNAPIGRICNILKHNNKKEANVTLSIKSTYQKLEFFVNGMKAIEARYLPLQSNGIGFFVNGEQTVDFDNLEFIQ